MKNRRCGDDIIISTVKIVGVLSWGLLIPAIFILAYAKPPEIETFFDRLFGVQISNAWDKNILSTLPVIFALIFVLTTTGIVLNLRRMKREEDRINRSLLVNWALSVIAMILFYFYM